MWDTIEHLVSPDLYLEKMHDHMERGALIAITTGDVESLNARVRKEKWRLIQLPTHIHYFSKKTLEKLLANCGFEVIYNRYCGMYRSLDTITYRSLSSSKKWLWLYDILRKSRLSRCDIYLNLYDILYVIARRV